MRPACSGLLRARSRFSPGFPLFCCRGNRVVAAWVRVTRLLLSGEAESVANVAWRGFHRRLAAGIAGFALILGGLFVLAGRLDYWQGWVFAATCILGLAASAPFFRRSADLISERLSPGPGVKPWDRVFWAFYLPAFVAAFVVAALDARR